MFNSFFQFIFGKKMDSHKDSESKLTPVILGYGPKGENILGKISYFKSQNCKNENYENPSTFKTHIFRGVFENKMIVCVRRFEKASFPVQQGKAKDQFTRDIEALQKPQHLHENFIRYFCSEEDKDDDNFILVAIEWCICSVEDLYKRDKGGKIPEYNWAGEKIDVDIIKNSLKKKELLRQATEGLAFLHALGFVHRNLKPSNFMIAQLQQFRDGFRYLVKLSDFRMSKNSMKDSVVSGTTGSHGWTYPRLEKGTVAEPETYFSGDVFILGCLFHYVLNDGQHPFGDNKHNRETNINNCNYDVYHLEWKPKIVYETADTLLNKETNKVPKKVDETAVTLLKDMIKFNLEKICTLDQVLGSRYFLPVNYYNLYDLPGVKPGLCVIFNQEIFDNQGKNRVGTNLDKEYLKHVFSTFGFDVHIYQNLKAQDLYHQIDELAKLNGFSFYASLVVCILSHGDKGVVAGVDSECIEIDDLKYKFNSNDCPSLNGKPKIWITQACQGGDVQQPIQTINPSEEKATSSSTEENKAAVSKKENLNKRPPLMDFLDVRATIPGYASFRNECSGSELIWYLCSVLQNECLSPNPKSTSFEDILKEVQNHINLCVYRVKLPRVEETIEAKQTIEWRVSLSDHIVFKKAEIPGIVKTISISEHESGDENLLTNPFLNAFVFIKEKLIIAQNKIKNF